MELEKEAEEFKRKKTSPEGEASQQPDREVVRQYLCSLLIAESVYVAGGGLQKIPDLDEYLEAAVNLALNEEMLFKRAYKKVISEENPHQ